jgi:co-chaperonin GroES (HSP10)
MLDLMYMDTLHAAGTRLLARSHARDTITSAGIVLPSRRHDRRATRTLRIVSVGRSVAEVSVGEVVMVPRACGWQLFVGATEYRVVEEEDVLCVLEGEGSEAH